MKLTFPWFLKELKPNHSSHFMQKAKAKAIYRAECARITQEALETQDVDRESKELQFTFYKPNRRHMDADNMLAAMKSGIDGMCDALGVNDKQFKRIVIEVAEDIGGYVEVKIISPR